MKLLKNNTKENLKRQDYSQIKNAMHLIVGDDPNWEFVEAFGNYQPKSNDVKKDGSAKFIPGTFYTTSSNETIVKEYGKMYKKLSWVREKARQNNLTKDDMLVALSQILGKQRWLCFTDAFGNKVSCEANQKGTERYNTKLRGQILDVAKELAAKDMTAVHLVLTCDLKRYKNLADAWENYQDKEVRPVMDNLRKNYGVEYLGVIESQENMNPHIHLMVFLPKGLYKEIDCLRNGTKIKYGRFFNYVKNHRKSPIFYMKVVKGKHTAHYLTKYIGKGAMKSVFKLLDQEEELTEEDWKLIYEFVLLTAFRRRKVINTRKGSKSKKVFESQSSQASVVNKEILKWKSLTASKKRSFLKSICINSLLRNPKTIYSMSYLKYKEVFGHFPERNQNFPEEDAIKFERYGRLVYAEENFYTLFVEFILSPKTAKLNRKFYWNAEENIYDLFSDGYNLDDDEDFLRCCKDLINFYVEECLTKGYQLGDVISGRAGLSTVKKKRRIGFNIFDDVQSEDPKEVYKTFEEDIIFRQTLNKGLALAAELDELEWQEKILKKEQESI